MYKRILNLLTLLLLVGQGALAQITECKGIVRSADNKEPIAGALVVISGTTHGAITDIDGRFYIRNIPAKGSPKLTISYLGYKTTEVRIEPYREIELPVENQMVGEIVVVAYGKSSKGALTGAVAQINSENWESRILTTPLTALDGAASGVQISGNIGDMQHSGLNIRIRGIGSVNGSNDPIVILDGMVVEYGELYSDINPNDIANISVLKDASATALYGNRAANGVVLITTKTGKGDCLTVEADIKQGTYTRGIGSYKKMGVKDWMQSYWKASQRSYIVDQHMTAEEAAGATNANLVNNMGVNIFNCNSDKVFDTNGNMVADVLPGYTDTDWMDEITRNGYRQEYNVNASVATEKYDFYASAGYLNENGYIKTTDMNRISGRVKANFRPNNWFKGGVNLSGNVSEGSYLDFEESSFTAIKNPFVTLERMSPIYSYYVHNADGNLTLNSDGSPVYNLNQAYLDNRNLIYEIYNNVHKAKRTTLSGGVYGTVSFLNDFQFTARGNLYSMNKDKREYQNNMSGEGLNTGIMTRTFFNMKQIRFTQELTWAHNFEDHYVDVFLAHEAYKLHFENDNIQKMGQKLDVVFPELSNFTSYSQSLGSETEYTTESYLVRGRYNYVNTYFVDASFRRDGSSRFYNSWGNFWSLGTAWLISNENFLKPITAINSLKLRASYGETGNDEISGVAADYYPYQAMYASGTYAGLGSYTVLQNRNTALTWEKNATFDIALEGRLLNCLNFTIEYYDRQSKDLLFAVFNPLSAGATDIYYSKPTSTTSGQSVYNSNIGNVSNRGWEFAIDVDVLRTKNWHWNIGLNITLPSNKITKLPNHDDIQSAPFCFSEGRSMYEFYLYQWAGVDRANGRGVYKSDLELATDENLAAGNVFELDNGEYYAYNPTYAKKDWCGSALPDCYGSIKTDINYKDLTLSMLGTWSVGGKIYDYNYEKLIQLGSDKYYALHEDLLHAWTAAPVGITEDYTGADRIDGNGVPRMDLSGEGTFFESLSSTPANSRALTNASYFVMKSISLQYHVPTAIIGKLGIQGLTLTGSVENAFTLTARKGLNPQYNFSGGQGATYVPARVFSIAANIKF